LGNVVHGSFRLSFNRETTASLPCDATADEVRNGLEALSNIGSVAVTRSAADYQLGYRWTIEFVSPMNSGPVSVLIADQSQLSITNPNGRVWMDVSSIAGNQLGGQFKVSFNGKQSAQIPFDASAVAFQQALTEIGVAAIAVTRIGPDGQLGYSWTVSFLSDFNRTFYGPQSLFGFDSALLTGAGARGQVKKLHVGTLQEVQEILVRKLTAGVINTTMAMELVYNGQRTLPIFVSPSGGVCTSDIVAAQSITSSTTDNSQFGGDSDVSMYLQFRLVYRELTTGWIDANPTGTIECANSASQIKAELEQLHYFHAVVVTGSSLSSSQDCQWTVFCTSSIGVVDQLKVQTRNSVTKSMGSLGFSSTSDTDTVTTATLVHGQEDAIKSALEQLDNIGTVTVTTASRFQSPSGECMWRVTFDSNAGDLNLLQVQLFNAPFGVSSSSTSTYVSLDGVDVTVSEVVQGTSSRIGGEFALSYLGARTSYLPFDASARMMQDALESLSTIGKVDVTRSSADGNNAYTWSITFLTNLGSLNLLQLDNVDMTGTVVNGIVRKAVDGVSPPFNSLDPVSQLSLGSAIITNLSDLSLIVDNLDEGTAYYFRVAALNAVGQSPYSFPSLLPYAIPQSQRPGRPTGVTLVPVDDGSSLKVQFQSPMFDGGQAVTFYRVDYATREFVPEVQQVIADYNATEEVQVVSISTSHDIPSVQLLYVSTSYQGSTRPEIQLVTCDATGGSFKLAFNGRTTPGMPYNANEALIASALQQLDNIEAVSVSFTPLVTQACFQRDSTTVYGHGFLVTFTSTKSIDGDLPLMTGVSNKLVGARFLQITELQKGDAPISGTVRLSFSGEITEPIPLQITDSAAEVAAAIQAALLKLTTIPSSGVVVSFYSPAFNQYSQIWRVTFVANVEPMQVVDDYNELLGSNVAISVLAGGVETSLERGLSPFPSVAGNQVSGCFTLSYRGHTTDLIDFNATDTDMKAKLETLPNIDSVNVVRAGPSDYLESTWRISFLKMPGSYPVGTGAFVPLVPNYATLLGGVNSEVTVTVVENGTSPLSGSYYSLTVTANGVSQVASNISAQASASQVEGFLNSLTNVGSVSVSRNERRTGYEWLVTFDGCKIVNGADVCNYDELMVPDNSFMASSGAVSVGTVLQGSGPTVEPIGTKSVPLS
jgi:enamine deaminase RidA (YjgF/YER057c/UK114 family)